MGKSNRIVLFADLRDSTDILMNFEQGLYQKTERQSDSGFTYEKFLLDVHETSYKELYLGHEAILGAAIVGRGAGDLIQPMVLAMTSKLKLTALTSMIAPYPTRGEINKRVAGQWYVPLLFSGRTRALVSLLKRLG